MRVTRPGSVVRWIILAFVTGTNLAAQSGPQPSLDERRYAGWVFTPSIAVGGGWDDNVLLANRANDPPSDYTSPISPSASLDFTGKRTRFSTSYNGAVTLYRTVDELNSFEHAFRAAFHQRLTPKLSIVAEENFAKSPTTDAIQLVGVPFYRVGSRTNTVGGGVDAALSKYTTLTARYSLRNVTFEDDKFTQRGLLGGHAHEASASISRTLSTRLTVSGNYSYLRGTEGQATRVIPVSANGTFDIQSGGAAATYRLTEFVSLVGGVGIARMSGTEQLVSTVPQTAADGSVTSTSSPLTSSEVGPTFQGGVTWRGEHHLASLTYQRSFIPSFGFGGTFQNEEWVANLRVPFARNRAYTDAAFAWFNNEPLAEIQPSLRSLFFSGKLGYRVSRWLNAEGYFERSQQNAQVAGGNLDRNQVGFRFVATRPMRLR
jgi:hypothetical protein